MEECEFEGCGNPIGVKKAGLCSGHYQQKWKGEELRPLRSRKAKKVVGSACMVHSCTRSARTRGLCASHASVCWRMSVMPDDFVRLSSEAWCFICRSKVPAVVFDHDHSCCDGNYSCGKCLRGTLCHAHNIALGHYEKGRSGPNDEAFRSYLLSAPHISVSPWVALTVDSHPGRTRG
jgi:hypothetical protein